MSRTPRIEYPGATFHITARGNRGEAIFSDREDSLKFLSIFEDICADHNWDCFAFVLMPTHYHLTVRTNEASLAKGMQRLNGRYAGWVNHRRGAVGHLLAGRYRAVVVDRQQWAPALIRLCALDPVRAGLATRAEQWLWSSWRYLAEEVVRDAPGFLAADEVRAWVPPGQTVNPAAPHHALQDYVERGLGPDAADLLALEALLTHNQVLGSPAFAKSVEAQMEKPAALTSTEPRPLTRFRETIRPGAKAMAAAYWSGGYRQKDIAAAWGTHISTVSRATAKYRDEFGGA